MYLGLLQEFSKRHGCAVHAYVLMSNHVHLLVSPPDAPCLSRMMRDINQVFVQYVNRHRNRCGTIWEGRPKICLVHTETYFLTCQRYLELNPVRAHMVEAPSLYPWSSYGTNATGRASVLITHHPVYLRLADTPEGRQAAYRQLFELPISQEELAKIRASVNGGWPLGNEAFRQEVQQTLGVKATPGTPGRPRKEKPGSDPGLTPVLV
jgi:putative transposase